MRLDQLLVERGLFASREQARRAVMAGAVNVIVDLEYPRLGLIRVDTFDQALIDLRKGMN